MQVVFQGYLVFTRWNGYWSRVATSWGYTIGPWMMISCFFLLLLTYMTKMRMWQGYWRWCSQPIKGIELREDVAPGDLRITENKNLWKRGIRIVLNAL